MILTAHFYHKNTITVAKQLLGTFLAHDSPQGRTAARIVETEAYLYGDDPASHAHRGMTKRNAVMFGPPGRAYIYFIYGMYYCFNVVTSREGRGEAVLIRAAQPVEGLSLMQERRRRTAVKDLSNGPGKLVIALGIAAHHNGSCLITGPVTILSRDSYPEKFPSKRLVVQVTTRIGISDGIDLPLRFYLKDNEFVSNARPKSSN